MWKWEFTSNVFNSVHKKEMCGAYQITNKKKDAIRGATVSSVLKSIREAVLLKNSLIKEQADTVREGRKEIN